MSDSENRISKDNKNYDDEESDYIISRFQEDLNNFFKLNENEESFPKTKIPLADQTRIEENQYETSDPKKEDEDKISKSSSNNRKRNSNSNSSNQSNKGSGVAKSEKSSVCESNSINKSGSTVKKKQLKLCIENNQLYIYDAKYYTGKTYKTRFWIAGLISILAGFQVIILNLLNISLIY